MDDRKIVKKGMWGGALFGLLSTLVWMAFEFFGLYGWFAAPLFGLLIPLGFFIFSKKHEFTTQVVVSYCALTIAFIISALYLGWLLDSYAVLLMDNGFSPSGVSIFEASVRLNFSISADPWGCLIELGKGLGVATVFLIISTLFLKRRTK